MKVIYLFILHALPIMAAFEFSLYDANLSGLSGSVAASDQIYSAYLLNPAVTAALNYHHLGIQYFKPYGISEINSGSLISNIITPLINVGLAVSTLGNDLYHENQVVANFSRDFIKKQFFLGVNFRWYSIQVKNYENLNVIGIDAGVQYRVYPNVLMGFSLLNLNQPSVYKNKEELPVIANLGMQVNLTDQFTSYISFQKDAWYAPSVRLGFSFWVNSFLRIQSGINSYPAIPSFGFQLKRSWTAVDYSLRYHFDLGITHFWGISFSKSVVQHDK
jgi:hypothetical protein